MRITAANYDNARKVSVYLRASRLADIVQAMFVAFMVWATLVSPMPTVAVLYLITLIVQHVFNRDANAAITRLEVSSTGFVKLENRQDKCVRVLTLYRPIMIQIVTEQGNKINVWRDACFDKDYRRLLVMLNLVREKRKE